MILVQEVVLNTIIKKKQANYKEKQAAIIAIADIFVDDEIYVDYGAGYWSSQKTVGKGKKKEEKTKNKYLVKILQMSDDDSEYETIPKKRKIKEISIPNGLVNGPVKHKKIKTPYAAKELFPFTGKFKYVFDDRKIRVLIRVSKQLRVLIRVLIRVIKIIKKLRV